MLLFTVKKEENFLGEKVIPIEIIDDLITSGVGEATKRSKRIVNRSPTKEIVKKQVIEKESTENLEAFQSDFKIDTKKTKNNKKDQKINKNKKQNQSYSGESLSSGSTSGKKNNEPEKGSLKGTGKIKITCKRCIRPDYPPIALRRGVEGKPVVKVWIDKTGNVINSKIITKSGIKSIDDAAKKAANDSTFYPIEKEISLNIEYDLRLK
tara:strand:- start:3652 stop:4278 length:627 start_codon:yes stop_codon:yes gene_type:complete